MEDDEPHIYYMNLGPWPYFVGFTMSPKELRKEFKRLDIAGDHPFIANEQSHASTHFLRFKGGAACAIIAMPKPKKMGRSRECYAALIAHEAMHVVQDMQRELAQGASLGQEAEAYLIQQIVQECLQRAYKTGLVIAREP